MSNYSTETRVKTDLPTYNCIDDAIILCVFTLEIVPRSRRRYLHSNVYFFYDNYLHRFFDTSQIDGFKLFFRIAEIISLRIARFEISTLLFNVYWFTRFFAGIFFFTRTFYSLHFLISFHNFYGSE